MTPEMFFQACDIIHSLKDVQKYLFRCEIWDKTRDFMNKYLKLKLIVTSTWFDIAMLIVIILNMGK